MSRAKKLLIVAFVLAIGISLAMPFRHPSGESVTLLPANQSLQSSALINRAPGFHLPAKRGTMPDKRSRQVAAQMASTRDDVLAADPTTGFDLEDHPALAGRMTSSPTERLAGKPISRPDSNRDSGEQSPVTPRTPAGQGESRPAYATSLPAESDDAAWPEEVIHVVHNGDTLEKLAERYLGDPGRALELFDLNREQLSNPHLLPIGAELRIPVPARRVSD